MCFFPVFFSPFDWSVVCSSTFRPFCCRRTSGRDTGQQRIGEQCRGRYVRAAAAGAAGDGAGIPSAIRFVPQQFICMSIDVICPSEGKDRKRARERERERERESERKEKRVRAS